MSDLRAGLRALITEYGQDGGNDDIEQVLDRAIALMRSAVLDRNAARDVLAKWAPGAPRSAVLDELEACIR